MVWVRVRSEQQLSARLLSELRKKTNKLKRWQKKGMLNKTTGQENSRTCPGKRLITVHVWGTSSKTRWKTERRRESRDMESWWSISLFLDLFNYPRRSKFSGSAVGVAGLHQSNSQCLLEYYYRTAATSQWADYWLGPMGGLIWLECMEAEMENKDKHRNAIYRADLLIYFYIKLCLHWSRSKRPGVFFPALTVYVVITHISVFCWWLNNQS